MSTHCASGMVSAPADQEDFTDFVRKSTTELTPKMTTPTKKENGVEKMASSSSKLSQPFKKKESFKLVTEGLSMFGTLDEKAVSPAKIKEQAEGMLVNNLIRADGQATDGSNSNIWKAKFGKGNGKGNGKVAKVFAGVGAVGKPKGRIVSSLKQTGFKVPELYSLPVMFGCSKCRYAPIGCKQCRAKKGYTLAFRVFDDTKDVELLWSKLTEH